MNAPVFRFAEFLALKLLFGGRFIHPAANRLEQRALGRARVFAMSPLFVGTPQSRFAEHKRYRRRRRGPK